MFEIEILLSNIVAPAAVILASLAACRALPSSPRRTLDAMLVSLAAVVAIWLAFALRNGFSLWPEDAWQKVAIAAWLVAGAAIAAQWTRGPAPTLPKIEQKDAPNSSPAELARFASVAASAAVATWLVFPRGEGWAELQSQLGGWMLAVGLAVSLAWMGASGCPPKVAAAVGFATIPILIAAAALTALSFMKVTEPLIAIATVSGIGSILILQLPRQSPLLPMLMAPATFATAAFLAHGQFYAPPGVPRALYFFAMFSPAVVALTGRVLHRRSTPLAVAAVFGSGLLLAVCLVFWTQRAGGFESADAW